MKKILVIEDEQTILEIILELLTEHGFTTFGAENGTTGIQLAQTHLPDLILCDVQMPDMNGFDVLTRLHRDPATSAIPFIFLTALGTRADMRRGMDLGADDYLVKPCTSEELLRAIASRFEKQEIARAKSQQQIDSLRNTIAMSLPHELRTPLNGIMSFSEILLQEHQTIEPQEIAEIATTIRKSADRLYKLIQNFLMYAQLEVTAYSPEKLEALQKAFTLDASGTIAMIASHLAYEQNRKADLDLNLQHASIRMGDDKLHKVMQEVIDNAFKFSAPDTAICVIAEVVGEQYVVQVIDHGRGMTAEQIARLGAYVQFSRQLYEQQGAGLGLAIAKRMVELHGGSLTVESTPGEKTMVQINLPLSDVANAIDPSTNDRICVHGQTADPATKTQNG